jgi:hypothetical protein
MKACGHEGELDQDLAGYFTPEEWSAARTDTIPGKTSEVLSPG